MSKPTILRLALPTPLRRLFDYLAPQAIDPQALIPGVRVEVPFQSRTLVGILIEVVQKSTIPDHKLKTANRIIDKSPIFTEEVFKLNLWAAEYYHYALGEVLTSALPVILRQGKAAKSSNKVIPLTDIRDCQPILNDAQRQAVQAIAASHSFQVFLLDGVTGSGKTEVYLQAIEHVLKKDQQALVLVPEISLTPQTIERFRARFPIQIAALHSSLSQQERLNGWLAAKSGEAKIVIGTRSAIFTPFAQLGLIIVDEEHDHSFKQQDRFRYHARDLSIMRAHLNHVPIVLGSATPSLESLLNVQRKRFQYLSLPERAGNVQLPQYQLLDLRQLSKEEGLTQHLLNSIREHLSQENQVMLFLNRRGFAPVLYCTQCHHIIECRRCDARMVYHRSPLQLRCHHCDLQSEIPQKCNQCDEAGLQPVGIGTQKLEQTLNQYFPDVPILRVDRDNTRKKGSMQTLLEQINSQKKAILLGTQMLAKGHHFPQVTLVGIIDADSGLLSADFRAAEQMGQLLLQVAGRAGRGEKPGTVVIQTYHPDHPLLQILIHQGYQAFAQALLKEREQSLLPPYSYFAVLRAEAYQEQNANQFLLAVKEAATSLTLDVDILGPVSALMSKRKGLHCKHLLMKAKQRGVLQRFLNTMTEQIEKIAAKQAVKWILDVDPVEI